MRRQPNLRMERSSRHETHPARACALPAAGPSGMRAGKRSDFLLLAAGSHRSRYQDQRCLWPGHCPNQRPAPQRSRSDQNDRTGARRKDRRPGCHPCRRRLSRARRLYHFRRACACARRRMRPPDRDGIYAGGGALLLPVFLHPCRRPPHAARARHRRLGASRVFPAQGGARR